MALWISGSWTSYQLPEVVVTRYVRLRMASAHVQILGGIGADQAYFDPLAFAPVTDRGPGVANWDFSLFRQFEILR